MSEPPTAEDDSPDNVVELGVQHRTFCTCGSGYSEYLNADVDGWHCQNCRGVVTKEQFATTLWPSVGYDTRPRHLRPHATFGDDPSGWCGCADCDPREDCGCSSCRRVALPEGATDA